MAKKSFSSTKAKTFILEEANIDEKRDIELILSKRELEVYNTLLQLKTNAEIADQLCISQNTLKTHISKIYKKLELKSRKDLLLHNRQNIGNELSIEK